MDIKDTNEKIPKSISLINKRYDEITINEKTTFIDCIFNGKLIIKNECVFINCIFTLTTVIEFQLDKDYISLNNILYKDCIFENSNDFRISIFINCLFKEENNFNGCTVFSNCFYSKSNTFSASWFSHEYAYFGISQTHFIMHNNDVYNIIKLDSSLILVTTRDNKIGMLHDLDKITVDYIINSLFKKDKIFKKKQKLLITRLQRLLWSYLNSTICIQHI